MRIGHFMPGHNINGGICSYIRRISNAQMEAGHQVLLFDRAGYVNPGEEGKLIITRDDAELFRLAAEHRLDILHLHSEANLSLCSVKTIRTVLVHSPYCPSGSQFFKRQGFVCERAYSLLGCSWGHIVDRCGSVRPAQFAAGFKRTWLEMRTLPRTRVLAISEFVKAHMIRSGYPDNNIHVLLLPAPTVPAQDDAPADQTASTSANFLFLGRLVRSKGMEWLLRASANVKGDFTVEIAGVGPEMERLKHLAGELGLNDRVRFHGWLPEPKVFELIARCRAVVFPSTWHEPAGQVTQEAASRGRAVIASIDGGIPAYARILGNSLLVTPNDIPGLAQAMQRLLDDPAEATRLGRIGRQSAQEGPLSLESHMKSLYIHYEEVTNLAWQSCPAIRSD
jgi:glycosyltransferase involved in cell wall biosynthesis